MYGEEGVSEETKGAEFNSSREKLSEVRLLPLQFSKGEYFPSYFTISKSISQSISQESNKNFNFM